MSSQGEKTISEILKGLNIDFIEQFKFVGCKDRRCLPFDYLIIINGRVAVIEFDGQQHFEITPRFHGSDKLKAEDKYNKQKNHDIIKNRYTRDNNISLLRVSYREQTLLLKYITDFINLMKNNQKRIDMFSNKDLYNNVYNDKNIFIDYLTSIFGK